jgi:hypothetical protein
MQKQLYICQLFKVHSVLITGACHWSLFALVVHAYCYIWLLL